MPLEVSRIRVQAIHWTEHCDVSSLGCTIFALCVLKAPFDYHMERDGDTYSPLPEQYSDKLRKCVDSCLSFYPETRPSALSLFRVSQKHLQYGKVLDLTTPDEKNLKNAKSTYRKSTIQSNLRPSSTRSNSEVRLGPTRDVVEMACQPVSKKKSEHESVGNFYRKLDEAFAQNSKLTPVSSEEIPEVVRNEDYRSQDTVTEESPDLSTTQLEQSNDDEHGYLSSSREERSSTNVVQLTRNVDLADSRSRSLSPTLNQHSPCSSSPPRIGRAKNTYEHKEGRITPPAADRTILRRPASSDVSVTRREHGRIQATPAEIRVMLQSLEAIRAEVEQIRGTSPPAAGRYNLINGQRIKVDELDGLPYARRPKSIELLPTFRFGEPQWIPIEPQKSIASSLMDFLWP